MDWTEIIIAVVGVISLVIEGFFIGALNHKRKKELQDMKNSHDVLMLKLDNFEKQNADYNKQKLDAIKSFLGNTKNYLCTLDSNETDEAYEKFAESSSTILLYLSDANHINGVKLLIHKVDKIRLFVVGYNDGSYEYRQRLVREALKIYENLYSSLSILGPKPPIPPQE